MKRLKQLFGRFLTGPNLKRLLYLVIILIVLILIYLAVNAINTGYTRRSQAEGDTETVELSISYAYQNSEWNAAIEQIIEDFEAENADISISYEPSYAHRVYEDLLVDQIAMGELGDLVQLKTPDAYVESGLLAEIPEEIAELATYNYTYDEEIYAVGMVRSTSGILYSKTVFDALSLEEPETYDDFLMLCEQLQSGGVTPVGIAGADLWHLEYWVNHFLRTDILAEDENWLKKCANGKVSWTDEEALAMLAHLYTLFSEGYVNSNWQSTRDTDLTYMMAQGEVAMVYTGASTATDVRDNNEEIELGWFYLPDEDGHIYVAENKDTYWGITQDCAADEDKYDAAVRFLKYFYSSETYMELLSETSVFSASYSVSDYEQNALQEQILQEFAYVDETFNAYIGDASCPQNFESDMFEELILYLSGKQGLAKTAAAIQACWEADADGGAAE